MSEKFMLNRRPKTTGELFVWLIFLIPALLINILFAYGAQWSQRQGLTILNIIFTGGVWLVYLAAMAFLVIWLIWPCAFLSG